jgi:hypothetical protein
LEKNGGFDFSPQLSIDQFKFRERERAKEIQADMKFKDRTALERIETYIKDHTQT